MKLGRGRKRRIGGPRRQMEGSGEEGEKEGRRMRGGMKGGRGGEGRGGEGGVRWKRKKLE